MSFKDSKGRQFDGVIVLPTVVKLKAMGVDLGMDLPKILEVLDKDPELLGSTLFVVHEASAIANGVTDVEFGQLLDGDTLPLAYDSLIDAMVNFSRPSTRAALRKLMQKSEEAFQINWREIEAAADKLDPASLLTSSKDAGDSQVSSESVSGDKTEDSSQSPSANST